MLSKLDKRCANCEYRDTCNNKRMCGLAYIDGLQLAVNQIQPNIQINIDVGEEIQKSLMKELRCGFNRR